MRKFLLLIACVFCLLLCACVPQNNEKPETTPAPTAPKPTPGMTIIAPSETPGEYIDPVDPSESVVIRPLDPTEGPTNGTPEPSPVDSTPSSPEETSKPVPDATVAPTEDGIHLPFVPFGPQ